MHFSMPSELVYIAAVVAIPLNRLGHGDNVGNHKLIYPIYPIRCYFSPNGKGKETKTILGIFQ